jgi:CMP/dCMP kinase
MKRFLVAIDGPAGAGKSTVACKVAAQLGMTYVDTGAMYRAVAWKAMQAHIDVVDEKKMVQLVESSNLQLDSAGAGIIIDGIRLKEEIRTAEVSALASTIAKMGGVREVFVRKQQEIGQYQNVVMDGRDIGTAVLPDADVKIFLTASIQERARRRHKEFVEKGIAADLGQLLAEIRCRDENDRTRPFGPLRQADDAILIDTTSRSIDEAVCFILQLCRNKMRSQE